ncbi:MAG: hypothetical protein R3F20_17285 [Planctomycetota bacterium]
MLALAALTAALFLYLAWSSARVPVADRGPRRSAPPAAAPPRPPRRRSRGATRARARRATPRGPPDPVPGGAWAHGRLLAREELVDGATILGARPALATMLYTIGFADAGAGEVEFVTRIPRPAGGRLAIVAARFDPPPSGLYQAGEGFYAVYHWPRRVEGVRISQEFDVDIADAHGFGPEREGGGAGPARGGGLARPRALDRERGREREGPRGRDPGHLETRGGGRRRRGRLAHAERGSPT